MTNDRSHLVPQPLARRTLLRGLLGTGAAAAALTVAATAAAAGDREDAPHGGSLVLDVACLFDTFRLIPTPPTSSQPSSPLYGSPFLVEGNLYAGRALEGHDGFDPRAAGGPAVIGSWLCRGWLAIRDERPHPEVVSTQLYLQPALGDGGAPQSQLVSEGLEGLPVPVVRSVTGGTGPYSGARGTVTQEVIGANTTVGGPAGLLGNGPNFRFTFGLR